MSRTVHRSGKGQIAIPLAKLIASRRNPRRVKPERDAHRRLVASIRFHGLINPLLVKAVPGNGHYEVIAGGRRLAALREVYRGDAAETKVPCVLRSAEEDAARALSLAENFIREPMHPLDESEAFADLAREDGKGVEAISAEFGVSESYVRQRMKLAALADRIKLAYRQGEIDTGTAEAFASVPPDRQLEVWQEIAGKSVDGHVQPV
jgi:ParB family transcriptional regulator, chromosome partitioning protein